MLYLFYDIVLHKIVINNSEVRSVSIKDIWYDSMTGEGMIHDVALYLSEKNGQRHPIEQFGDHIRSELLQLGKKLSDILEVDFIEEALSDPNQLRIETEIFAKKQFAIYYFGKLKYFFNHILNRIKG